jgi:hypothetical protein
MSTLGTVLMALLVPVLWGLLSAWAFDRVRLRRECKAQEAKVASERKTR